MAINMGYCSFENTLEALMECEDALREGVLDDPGALSDREMKAVGLLLELCRKLADDYPDESEY